MILVSISQEISDLPVEEYQCYHKPYRGREDRGKIPKPLGNSICIASSVEPELVTGDHSPGQDVLHEIYDFSKVRTSVIFTSNPAADIPATQCFIVQCTEELATSAFITSAGVPVLEEVDLRKRQMCYKSDESPVFCRRY